MAGYSVSAVVSEPLAHALAETLGGVADAVSTFRIAPGGDWLVEAVGVPGGRLDAVRELVALTAAAGAVAAPELSMASVPERAWLADNRRGFQPIRAGRFFIHASTRASRPPPGAWPLMIDAGQAFGSGEHATTFGCLLAMDRLARQTRLVRGALDLGCGAGVLALAAARAWPARVVAADIDPIAVATARDNARRNGLHGRVRALCADGFAARAIAAAAPYDLIVANILAPPLRRFAGAASSHLAPGATIVLSGLLADQEAMVRAAYRGRGLALRARIVIDGWATLIMNAPAASPPACS